MSNDNGSIMHMERVLASSPPPISLSNAPTAPPTRRTRQRRTNIIDEEAMENALQWKREHQWVPATECAKLYDVSAREVQRRLKDPSISRRANNSRPTLL